MTFPGWRGCAAALLLAFTTAATGHSESDTTRPADGASLDTPPDEIRIRFEQPIRITMVRITDDDGDEYDITYDRGKATDTLVDTPESRPNGTHTVKWRGLSEDGHPASGELGFRIE